MKVKKNKTSFIVLFYCRTHTDERPFQCALCDKSFRTLSNRTDHLATHVDDKKFKVSLLFFAFRFACTKF